MTDSSPQNGNQSKINQLNLENLNTNPPQWAKELSRCGSKFNQLLKLLSKCPGTLHQDLRKITKSEQLSGIPRMSLLLTGKEQVMFSLDASLTLTMQKNLILTIDAQTAKPPSITDFFSTIRLQLITTTSLYKFGIGISSVVMI